MRLQGRIAGGGQETFCFIEGSDGQNYFAHRESFQSREAFTLAIVDRLCSFEPTDDAPKGLRAEHIILGAMSQHRAFAGQRVGGPIGHH
jgi:hypothetical protein